MFHIDWDYSYLLFQIMQDGILVNTRNSEVKRLRNLRLEITSTPLISIRRTAWKNALREMEWFLSGSNNINNLHEKVHHWWEPWADEKGKILNNYGEQFRAFSGFNSCVDQIQYMIDTLKTSSNSRRNVITTWNTADMLDENTPITNCHGSLIQAFVENEAVHLTMYQRSADMILGVPHNFIQYWALLMYLAHSSGKEVGSLTWLGGDCHIYKPHYDMANKIEQEIKKHKYNTPQLVYTPTSDEFRASDFFLDRDYKSVIKSNLELIV